MIAAVQRVAATLDNMVSASGIIDTTGHTTYTDVLAQVKHADCWFGKFPDALRSVISL